MWSNISTSSSPARASDQLDDGLYQEQSELQDRFRQNDGQQQCKQRYGSPLVRYKHAVCAAQASGYIYIHGGRFGNLPLDDDVWRFDPHQNSWIQLQTTGCKPPSLQEHTLIEYGDQLYLFGGQISASSNGSSFWCLNLADNQWRSLSMKGSSRYGAYLGPTNRRGHTAVLYSNSMYIYGGFEDFRGSSGQLWEYDLLNERWELRNLSATSSCHPEPRHSHSAIVYNDCMYIYGGLSNLKPLADLWRWSWRDRRWFRERTKGRAPGQLHGHTAIQAFGSMFVFGGERNGRTTRGLWRLNLSNMTWQKIRPKGPRPNPTTWHGAIANPLCILDEANYIIEGDPELILKDVSGDNCCQMVSMAYDDNHQTNSSSGQQEPQTAAVLSHSKSSNGAESMVTAIRNGLNRSKQRKSRLSFLRKNRQNNPDRPKSIYELKQIRTSLSANNFKRDFSSSSSASQTHNRHSVTLTRREVPNKSSCDHQSANGATSMECESQQTNNNVGILDSLDTDIKEMFQRAMSPKQGQSALVKTENCNDEMPMSVDMSSRSHYVTAPIERAEGSQTISSSMNHLRSQRTSCAYTTPPSEMNTLREDSNLQQQQQQDQFIVDETKLAATKQNSRALLASTPSGYDKRDNRPRSEIVQSLIDRADARIKHLYTPYFNQQQPSVDRLFVRNKQASDQRQSSSAATATATGSRRGQSFLDKSKRHTIHQTMTYYNLYYSEESKSSSGDSAGNQESSSNSPKEDEQSIGLNKIRDIDDFGSSSTMKGSTDVGQRRDTPDAAVLVGVHQNQQPSRLLPMPESQQADQMSLLDATSHTQNSSETRTLCGQESSQFQPTSDEQANNTNSFPNALTARRDTSAESCDNTSLSFSVIAEFEEDDMLQFSSPVTVQPQQQNNNIATSLGSSDDDDDDDIKPSIRSTAATNRVETILFREPEDQLQTMILTDHQSNSSQTHRIETNEGQEVGQFQTHNKSSSSGYDSIASRCRDTPSQEATVDSNNHQGGSIRTTESVSSSMVGGLSSSTTIDTTTSPEQSAIKKLRARYQPELSGGGSSACPEDRMIKTTVLSADSLAGITSSSTSTTGNDMSGSPQKAAAQHCTSTTTTTAPTTNQQVQTVSKQATQAKKMPLMSRSRFFGRSSSKSRYWQLCMFVIGGKQGQGSQGVNEPITVWRLYI